MFGIFIFLLFLPILFFIGGLTLLTEDFRNDLEKNYPLLAIKIPQKFVLS